MPAPRQASRLHDCAFVLLPSYQLPGSRHRPTHLPEEEEGDDVAVGREQLDEQGEAGGDLHHDGVLGHSAIQHVPLLLRADESPLQAELC